MLHTACERRISMCGHTAVPEDGRTSSVIGRCWLKLTCFGCQTR